MNLEKALQVINELKAETYGKAIGLRLNKANDDVNKERKAEKEFQADKGNQTKANTLDDLHAHNNFDYDSNVQKAARAIERAQDFKRKRNWSDAEKDAFQKAAEEARTIKADGGPYSVAVSHNPSRTSKIRRDEWKKSYARYKNHDFNKNEALELIEAIINEVSVGALARATENNLAKRKADSDVAVKGYNKALATYKEASAKHPGEEPALYRKLQADDEAASKVFDKASHAKDLADLNLPKNSKVPANKLFKAAHKVVGKRDKDSEDAIWSGDKRALGKINRYGRAIDIDFADPVKSRTNEALELIESIYDYIKKRHGEPRDSIYTGKNRAAHLYDKVNSYRDEMLETRKGDTDNKYTPKNIRKTGEMYANSRTNKNSSGEQLTLQRQPETINGRPREHWEKDEMEGIQASIRRHNKKMNKNEASAIAEEMFQLASSIFEVAPETSATGDVPPSPNKLKREETDKNGKKTELVSVADELFPYEGTAKEQFNKKVLAKINDMIEGTGTLEDLLQLVRSGAKKQTVRESFGRAELTLEQLINEVSRDWLGKRLEAGNKKQEEISKDTEEILADEKATETEKSDAILKKAKYYCKNANTYNKACDYVLSKSKKRD